MDKNETRLTIKKILPASVEDVYSAWVDPKQLVRWHAPGNVEVKSVSVDLNIGGHYKIEMKADNNNPIVTGEYIEIDENKRLVFTWRWEGDSEHKTLVTIDFEPKGDETEITLTHERFSNCDTRDKHQSGWNGCLDNLKKLIQ